MIKIKNISKRFVNGKSLTIALKDINLEIQEGDFLAIVGPSGSGKSTLLNLIGGLDTASEGSISIHNKDISTFKDKQLSKYRNHDIGFVFQEFHLEANLTVQENILLPSYFNSPNKNIKNRAKKLIREVELESKADSKINELSGGQKQRVAIARALINKPMIFLADEPTGNLDEKTGQTIIDLLNQLHKTHNTTLIIATHDKKIANAAQKTIKILDGKLC